MENNTTEPSTIPEYPSKYSDDTVTENNEQNNTIADLGITIEHTVISENMTTKHSTLENSATKSKWERGFTDMENYRSTTKIIATGQENIKTTPIQDVTTVVSSSKDNAIIKHTNSEELATVSNNLNRSTVTITDGSITEENVTRGEYTRNRQNTTTNAYFLNGGEHYHGGEQR